MGNTKDWDFWGKCGGFGLWWMWRIGSAGKSVKYFNWSKKCEGFGLWQNVKDLDYNEDCETLGLEWKCEGCGLQRKNISGSSWYQEFKLRNKAHSEFQSLHSTALAGCGCRFPFPPGTNSRKSSMRLFGCVLGCSFPKLKLVLVAVVRSPWDELVSDEIQDNWCHKYPWSAKTAPPKFPLFTGIYNSQRNRPGLEKELGLRFKFAVPGWNTQLWQSLENSQGGVCWKGRSSWRWGGFWGGGATRNAEL